ncbi:transposase [Streptomyces zhihengii]|uniref:transposase n=1 Tax=Streptomyces zhihengii TaxID=1818004 RepID=UPI0033AC20FE
MTRAMRATPGQGNQNVPPVRKWAESQAMNANRTKRRSRVVRSGTVLFADWYPRDGRPSLSPAQLATVCVLQFLLGLSDRQVAEAVGCRFEVRAGHGTGRSRLPPQRSGRLPRASHRGRPSRPSPRPRSRTPEGGRSSC